MRIRYKEMPFTDLTADQREYLYDNLTLKGNRSVMKQILAQEAGDPDRIVVSIAYNGNWPVGWCLAEVFGKSPSANAHVMTFVKEKYRRLGIGTELVRRASRFARRKKVRCFMWDKNSTAFYVALGANKVPNPNGYLRFIPQGEVLV